MLGAPRRTFVAQEQPNTEKCQHRKSDGCGLEKPWMLWWYSNPEGQPKGAESKRQENK